MVVVFTNLMSVMWHWIASHQHQNESIDLIKLISDPSSHVLLERIKNSTFWYCMNRSNSKSFSKVLIFLSLTALVLTVLWGTGK